MYATVMHHSSLQASLREMYCLRARCSKQLSYCVRSHISTCCPWTPFSASVLHPLFMDSLPEYAELDTLEEVPRSEEQKDTVIFHKSSSSHGAGVVVPYPLPPTYTSSPSESCARRPPTHTFTLNSDLSVRLTSHAARDDSTPIFHNGSTISGTAELVVKSGLLSTLDSVTVSVRFRSTD